MSELQLPEEAKPVAWDLRTMTPGFRLDWSGLRNRIEEFALRFERLNKYELRSAELDEAARQFEGAVETALRTVAEQAIARVAELQNDLDLLQDAKPAGDAEWRERFDAAEKERSEQWRLRRDAEGSRDAADAACDTMRIERDKAEATVARLREALRPFADEANWRQGAAFDPNSPSFCGTSLALGALSAEQPKGE